MLNSNGGFLIGGTANGKENVFFFFVDGHTSRDFDKSEEVLTELAWSAIPHPSHWVISHLKETLLGIQMLMLPQQA